MACNDTCPVGWVAQAGSAICTECGTGRIPNDNRDLCVACEEGKHKSGDGSTCEECAPGSRSSMGADACTLCDAGTFEENRLECKDCGEGMVSPRGSTECAYNCSEGYYIPRGSVVCEPCRAGKRRAAELPARGLGTQRACL